MANHKAQKSKTWTKVPTCLTAPVLGKKMLAMMSLMQTLAKDDSPAMSAPRAALLKRLEEVASKEWLMVLRESMGK